MAHGSASSSPNFETLFPDELRLRASGSQVHIPTIPLCKCPSSCFHPRCSVLLVVCFTVSSRPVAPRANLSDLKVCHSTYGLHIRFMIFISTVISGKNLQVPSFRIPAGIYVSIKLDSRRCWKSAIRVPSSDSSVVWGDTVHL